MQSLWKFFLVKQSFTKLLIVSLVLFGGLSVVMIPKESAPEVIIPVGIVTTVLRGGSSEDVEKLITNKLEQEIGNVENIDKLTSTSREGVSVISAQFLASADVDKSIADLKDAIDKVKGELPSDATEPTVTKVNFSEQPIIIASLSKDATLKELSTLGEKLEKELEKVPGVSKVEISGINDEEVQVVLRQDKLLEFGVSSAEVVRALQAGNVSSPIGKIVIDGVEYPVKFSASIEDASEVENVAFNRAGGGVVYLKDVAYIFDGFKEASSYSRVSVGGEPSARALSFLVFKKSGGDITQISDAINKKLDELKNDLLVGSEVIITIDAGKEIKKDLNNLLSSGLQTVLLVVLILFLTLGWRESVVAGLSIPLSFVIAFIGLYYSGNTINFLSLFSLILAIGILVDSGIVVSESIHTRMKRGKTALQAAQDTIAEYSWPLIAGTMTTVAVFAPLFFLSGIVGQFVKSIPFTIIFVLISSIFVALGLVPLIASWLLSKEEKDFKETAWQKKREEYFYWAQGKYKAFLKDILLNKTKQRIFLWGLTAAFISSIAIMMLGLIKVELFPQDDQPFVVVSVELPEGSSLDRTDLVVRQVEEILYNEKTVASFVTTVGGSSALTDNSGGTQSGKLANITIMLPEDRDFTSSQAVDILRAKLQYIDDGIVKVGQANNGPPSGKPIVIKLLGEDLDAMSQVASQAEDILKTVPGTIDVETSLKDDGTQFEFSVDRGKAALLGVAPGDVASALRTAISGTVSTTINKQENDVDILVKMDLNPSYLDPSDTNIVNPDQIKNITLKTQTGGEVFLGDILDVKLTSSRSRISHEEQKRVVTISADLKDGYVALDAVNDFKQKEKLLSLGENIEINYGGETEDVDNTFRDMALALIFGIILMFAIVVLEFNSARYSFYLLTSVPLSIIGVMWGLFITQMALSFSAMLGLIALAGVIINNGIILLDSILHLLDKKLEEAGNDSEKMKDILTEAVAEASSIRMRPVILTTTTTVVGMIPLIFVSALWGPLAVTIMFGLFFATLLTLVLVPLLFYRNPGPKYRHLTTSVATYWGAIKALVKFVWYYVKLGYQKIKNFKK